MTPREELHARMDNRSRNHARHGRHFMTEATKPVDQMDQMHPAAYYPHELYTPRDALPFILAVWQAAKRRRVTYKLEDMASQTHLIVVCTDVDWVFLQGEGRGE